MGYTMVLPPARAGAASVHTARRGAPTRIRQKVKKSGGCA